MIRGIALRHIESFLILFLIALMLFLSISSLKQKSFTTDEQNWLNVGQELVRNLSWDTQLKRNHPPLTFYLHGLPSLILQTTDSLKQLFWARLAMQPLLLVFALAFFIYTKKIFDKKIALIALFLFCLNIEILAHGRLITKDLSQAFFIFICLMEFYFFLTNKKPKEMFKTGLFLGLALLTKYSAFLLLPLFLILILFYSLYTKRLPCLKTLSGLLAIILIAFLLINIGFLFRGSALLPEHFETKFFRTIRANSLLNRVLLLLPKPYLQGFDHIYHDSQRNWGHSFFWGENRNQMPGLWYFFILTFLVKTPIPLLILFLTAIPKLFLTKKVPQRFFLFYLLVVIFFFFFYLSFFLNLIIGFRYILIIFPLIFILVAWFLKTSFYQGGRIKKVMLLLLIGWYLRETLMIYPHFLAYTNQLIGGPKKAYQYFADSNLDWGQDWLLIHEYLDKHPGITFDPKKPTVGKIAVSVNSYNMYNFNDYLWLRNLKKEPIDNVGYTWLIFEIRKQDLIPEEN